MPKYPAPNPARVRARREELGLTRQQLAEQAGMDETVVVRLETFYPYGVGKVMAAALCRVLQTDYESLMEGALVPQARGAPDSPTFDAVFPDRELTPQDWRAVLQEGARMVAAHPGDASLRSTVNTVAKLATVASRFMKNLTAEDEKIGAATQEELAAKLKKMLDTVLEGLPEDVRAKVAKGGG